MQSNDPWNIDLGNGLKFPGWLHIVFNTAFLVLIYNEFSRFGTYQFAIGAYLVNFAFDSYRTSRIRKWYPKQETYHDTAEKIGNAIGNWTSPVIGPLLSIIGPVFVLLAVIALFMYALLKHPLKFRHAFRYLLDHETRHRIFDNGVNELMLDFLECNSDLNNSKFKTWFGICFRIRVALLFVRCVQIMIVSSVYSPGAKSTSKLADVYYANTNISSETLTAYFVLKFPSSPSVHNSIVDELVVLIEPVMGSVGDLDELLDQTLNQRAEIELPKKIKVLEKSPAFQVALALLVCKQDNGRLKYSHLHAGITKIAKELAKKSGPREVNAA